MRKPVLDRLGKAAIHFFTDYTWTFAVVLVITVVGTAFSIQFLTAVETRIQDVYENDVRGGDSVQTALIALLGVENAAQALVLGQTPEERAKADLSIEAALGQLQAAVRAGAPRFYTPKAKAALVATQDHLKDFVALKKRVHPQTPKGGEPTVLSRDGLRELKAGAAELRTNLERLISNREANSTKGVGDLLGQLRLSLVLTIAVLVITLVVRVVMYWAGHPLRKPPADDQTNS
ncbi:MAG: hypothetical protein WCG80_00350 [Spirochaetales bacterium]